MGEERIIIFSSIWGIYLGEFLGLGFWTKLDHADQDAAITFESEEVAKSIINSWDSKPDGEITFPKVETGSYHPYLTEDGLMQQGFDGWLG